MVEHLFATTTTTGSCSSPPRAGSTGPRRGSCPRPAATPRAAHVAGLLSFLPDEEIAQVLAICATTSSAVPGAGHEARAGQEDPLTDYDSPRQAGVIAVNFRDEDDELIGAELCRAEDDLLLISRKAQAIRFAADDDQLRPMGRATSGVTGMKFRSDDDLLSMSMIQAGQPRTTGSSSPSPTAASPSERRSRSTAAGPWRPGHQGDEDQRGAGLTGRRAGREGQRRGHRDQGLAGRSSAAS